MLIIIDIYLDILLFNFNFFKRFLLNNIKRFFVIDFLLFN